MTLNTKGRPGRWSRTVEVWTNDPEKKMVVLSFSVDSRSDMPVTGNGEACDK